jgi:hypothetical protein
VSGTTAGDSELRRMLLVVIPSHSNECLIESRLYDFRSPFGNTVVFPGWISESSIDVGKIKRYERVSLFDLGNECGNDY